ncbi:MAG: peptidoglycan-binding protein [Candidatus Omnitrophica bacterium]|nr:peptidoglycan-binding protein [Candidatus Omnitrophota bacterium]
MSTSGFSSTELPSEGFSSSSETGSTKSRPSSAATVRSKSSASSKPSTREIQQALKDAGFYQGSVDGKMGPLTRQAVEEFQRVNGLTPDGVVGRQTWAKLKQYAGLSGSGDATYAK